MKRLATLTMMVFLCSNAWPLEKVSYRIKALGGDLQGVVADTYTDVLFNPARMQGGNTTVTGKIGQYGNPFTVGYFTRGQWALLGEGYENITQSESLGTSLTLQSQYSVVANRDYISRSLNEAHSLDMGLLKAVPRNGYALGFAVYPSWSLSKSDYDNDETYTNSNQHTGVLLYKDIYKNSNKNETESQAARIDIGYYTLAGEGIEKDVVYSVLARQTKSIVRSGYYRFTDNDPDLNGQRWDGWNTVTPNYNSQFSQTETKQDYRPQVGAAFRYQTRRRPDPSTSKVFRFESSWQPERIEREQLAQSDSYSVSGAAVSQSTSTKRTTISGRNDVFQAAVTAGATIEMLDRKLLAGYALRGDASYRAQNTDTTQDALSLGSSRLRSYSVALSVPFGLEYYAFSFVSLRWGVTPRFTMTSSQEEKVSPWSPDCAITSRSTSQSAVYSAGFGVSPFDALELNFVTSGEVLNLNNWQMQFNYMF